MTHLDPDEMTWMCDVCGDVRPDACVSIRTIDISKDLGLPEGAAKKNIKYCNDRDECFKGARRMKGL